MSIENPESTNAAAFETKMNGDQQLQQQPINGLSNGHLEKSSSNHVSSSSSKHKSSSKDKYRDRDRGDHKSSSHRKDSDRDKHNSNSSSKDKHRDKDREREKHKSSSHKSSRDKDRDKHKDRDKNREHHRSSDDKNRDKHRDRDKSKVDGEIKDGVIVDVNKDKDRKKDHKSSSDKDRKERSDKDKDKKSSSSSHHKSSSSTHHRSSSNKHSSSHSSKPNSDRDKNHDSSRQKDRHRSDKDRHRSDKSKSSSSHKRNTEIKQEFGENFNQKIGDIKELKVELEVLPDKYNSQQGFSNFDPTSNVRIKEEKVSPIKLNNSYRVKDESFINHSQASSCDYSMSQFRDDEPRFETKHYNESFNSGNFDENGQHGISIKNEDDNSGNDYADEDDEEEDIPLAKRKAQVIESDDDDDIPLVSRKKVKQEDKKQKKKSKKREIFDDDEDDYDEKPKSKKVKKEKVKIQSNANISISQVSPIKGRKKKEDEQTDDVWRWWEEEKREDGVKWNFLEHRGPVFAPLYERLPKNVQFFYDGKPITLTDDTEEVACFYARMLNHDYVTKKQFNDNFFKDWRKTMTSKEKDVIKDLKKCNFNEMHQYFVAQSEKNKNRTKEEKLSLKETNEALIKEYGFCTIDGHKERIGNFKLEPPGLFRGRGEHPKMGLVKRRIKPEDVLINCSKNSKIPEPPKGHRWKEVRHDNSVTWLASWIENVQGQVKYIMLNPSSKLKGEKDHQKYEIARKLDKHIEKIRETYREEWKSKEMRIRQRGVALYFIDKLALRAGNEKDEDQADTVGCCSLRVEHVQLKKKLHDKENVVVFDFLGKDSIRYYNEVEVEKRVFKNLELFMENKKEGDELFDRLNTSILNDHLRDLMEGLTAKVFRTYNASITLQNQLRLLTEANSTVPEKLLAYNRANRAVAVLCNHQRSVPKSHEKSMENLKEKIRNKQNLIADAEAEYHELKKLAKRGSVKEKLNADKKLKQLERLQEQLKKLELQETDRDENKTIALGTSKLNYLDPRISVAWCKKHGVPLEKIFNKTQREKFRWAIHMADENYVF